MLTELLTDTHVWKAPRGKNPTDGQCFKDVEYNDLDAMNNDLDVTDAG